MFKIKLFLKASSHQILCIFINFFNCDTLQKKVTYVGKYNFAV